MFNGTIKPVFNDEIIAEYTDVLHRPKFRMRDEDRFHLLHLYLKAHDRQPSSGTALTKTKAKVQSASRSSSE